MSIEYKKSYAYIFILFYLVQGLYNGLQAVILPIYLISSIDSVELGAILGILAIVSIPWAVKFLIGLINDKYSFGKYGRRIPIIFVFGIFAGISFIIGGLGLETSLNNDPLGFATIFALLWNIGIAIADTALDGLILDIVPKDKLGRIQGNTWSANLLGSTALAIGLGVLFFIFNIVPVFFIIEGFLLFIVCALPIMIKEPPKGEVKALQNFKKIIFKLKNWKVFLFSLFDNVPYGIALIAYGLLVMVYMPNSPIQTEITSITLMGQSAELFILFSLFGLFSGIGVIIGSIYMGKISDKNRRKAVYFANLLYIPALVISVLFSGILNKEFALTLGIIMLIILGAGQGSLNSAYQSVRADLAKKYPDLDATYFAIIISMLNLGTTVGYGVTALLLPIFSDLFTEFYLIYFFIMLIMAGFQTLALVIFLTIPKAEYEFARHLEESK